MTNRNGKWWTPEEDAFLEEKVGKVKIETIAKKLGRSVIAVENRLDRLGVSNTKLESGKITAAELARYCGIDSHVVTRTWIPKKGLPAVRRVTRYKRKYWLIDVKEFWKWAEQNKDLIDFSKVDTHVLLPQPDWVELERKRDYKKIPRKQLKRWTAEEDNQLIKLLNAGYSKAQIAEVLERSETAVDRRIARLKVAGKIPYEKIDVPWTEKELEMLIELERKGLSDKEIAYELGREVNHIRDKRSRLGRKKLKANVM